MVHLCTIVPISKSVGANRIYPAVSIPHPAGYPNLSREEEKEARLKLVRRALETTAAEIKEQTVFRGL